MAKTRRGQASARPLRWIVACVAAGVVLALVLALSLGGAAQAEGDDDPADVSQSQSDEVKEPEAGGDGQSVSGDEDGEEAAAKPNAAPAADPSGDDPEPTTGDGWHDANGLPSYGVRIVLDDSSASSDNTGDEGLGLDIRVRAKNGATTDGVVLEKYRYNYSLGKYVLLANWHFTVPTNNWGSENYNTDNQNAWYWYDGFNFRSWQFRDNQYQVKNTYSYNGGDWFTTQGGVFDYNQKSTSWQRWVLMLHAFGNSGNFNEGGWGVSNWNTHTDTAGNYYGSSNGEGYFSSKSDVYVLRAADTSNVETALTYNESSDKTVVAPKSDASFEYQIQTTRYGQYGATYGVSSSTDDPQSISTWTPLSEGAYGDFTGVRDIPTSGVETVDATATYRSNDSGRPATLRQYGIGDYNSGKYDGYGHGSYPSTFTADSSFAKRVTIVRNQVDGDASSYGSMPVAVTVFTSDDEYNTNPGWGSPNYQLDVHAYVYSYDSSTGTYTYGRSLADNGCTGIHLGAQSSYSRLNTSLGPNEVLVIVPQSTLYEYTYRLEAGSGYTIDSVDDASRGTLTNIFQSYSTYESGEVATFPDAYAAATGSVRNDVVVLHSSAYETGTTPVIASNTFTQLTDDNIGAGKSIRSLKVNLFDYDIPDDWHFTMGNDNSQGDVQFRFVSDSDASSNLQDPEVNLVNSRRRMTPYTGILQKTLGANGLPEFNYTTAFESQGGLFSTARQKVTEQGNAPAGDGQAYKWAVATHYTTSSSSYANSSQFLDQLAEPGAPITWWNGSGDKTYTNTRTKEAYADVDFDFVYTEATGYYSYNSSNNHAQLTSDGTAVHQYDHALGMGGNLSYYGYGEGWGSNQSYTTAVYDNNGARAAGFFPFDSWESAASKQGYDGYGSNYYGKSYSFQPKWNDAGTTLLRKEEDLDYHFGLSTTQTFAVPEGGKVKGEDMVFSFSGDDDFWLFVDGQLVLDIGGIHESCPGSVNFTQGTYTVGTTTGSLSEIFADYASQYPTAEDEAGSGDWAAGTVHTFSVFYLERGGTFSNLSIRFNTPIVTAQATKVWDDNDDALGLRKDATLHLEKTEGTISDDSVWTDVEGSERTIKADATNTTVGWAGDDYPMLRYDDATSANIPVHYRVVEGKLGDKVELADGYTPKVEIKTSAAETWAESGDDYDAALAAEGTTAWRVTNTLETTSVKVSKVWNDVNDADGLRPGSVTVNVLRDGDVVDTLTLNADNDWTAESKALPKTDSEGNEISYTISEVSVEGYAVAVSGDAAAGFVLTNTHTPKTSVKVTKVWDDLDNADGIRPPSVVVQLLANGEADGTTLTLDADHDWTGSFDDLDTYDADGNEIAYTVAEVPVDGYETTIDGTASDGFTITNTHEHVPGKTAVRVTKVWDDGDDADGVRPKSVTVHLLANGEEIDQATLSAENNWTVAFTNLDDSDASAKAIVYDATEDPVEGYTSTRSGSAEEGFTFTNTHEVTKKETPKKTTTPKKTGTPNTGDPTSWAGAIASVVAGSGAIAAAWGTRRRRH